MKTLSHIFLAGLTFTVLAVATVSMWVLEPMTTKQKFVVIPAIEKEIKVKFVSAIDNKIKVRPIGHVGRSVLSLRDQLEGSDPIPDEISIVPSKNDGFEEEITKVTDPLEASKISGWCCVLEGTYHCKTTRRDVRSSDYYVLVMLSGSGLANDTVLKNSN